MDLFRYAVKLWPYIPSSLLADTLELALAARVLDMRASPYDLSSWHQQDQQGDPPAEAMGELPGGAAVSTSAALDLTPVRIETADGKREYQVEQAALAQRSQPLRRRVMDAYAAAIAEWDEEEGGA